jgi:hypothetical protein
VRIIDGTWRSVKRMWRDVGGTFKSIGITSYIIVI